MLAKELNEAGLTIMETMKHDAEIPWTAVLIKELMFKKLIKVMYQKESTTKLTTKELIEASETLTRYLAEKHGLVVDFPSLESQMMRTLTK